MRKKVKQISEAENRYAADFGILKNTIVTDIQLFIPCSFSSALRDNIDNLATTFNNNTVAGLFSTYRAAGLERELEKERKAREILLTFIGTVGMKELFRTYIKNKYVSSN
ncbi:MAG: hypothetical protein LUD15_01885 [Bacteroides sp.]|nr:hypothetical protein [Bacteroides sp.]